MPLTLPKSLYISIAFTSLLIVSAGLMYQLSTDTLCLIKLCFIYFGNVGFWLAAGNAIGKLPKLTGNIESQWLVRHAVLMLGLILINQVIIYGLVEFVFRVGFGCSAGYGTWEQLQTNHIMPHILAYGIIVLVQHYFSERSQPAPLPDFLVISQNGKQIKLAYSDIRYVQADNNAIILFASTNRKYVAYRSLKSLESELDPTQFVRVHRSFIVQRDAIAEYRSKPSGDGTLVLDDGTEIKVSRNYKAQLRRSGSLATF